MGSAFREMCQGWSNGDVGIVDFCNCMARLRIAESEAVELFEILDSDGSGGVSLEELSQALRSVSPTISTKDFWQRWAAEWPEVVEAACECSHPVKGREARQHLGFLLAELLPEEIRSTCEGRSAPQVFLESISSVTFDALAVLLDVSEQNAAEIFERIASTANRRDTTTPASLSTKDSSRPQSRHELRGPHAKGAVLMIFIEDFAEYIQLWCDRGLNPTDGRRDVVRQAVAPARAAISAFKALLQPHKPSTVQEVALEATSQAKAERDRGRKRSLPKLTWQSYYSAIPTMTPAMFGG
ncbi:unnamed protein product [Polarella glacialis]|uniref:EF-hand domain-containing protein n=1 Tax=Polarella glacialis TaxID=89957 RepID=A0A813HM25_POLGL|nr:unnamed protein product [Polarella glacialis]